MRHDDGSGIDRRIPKYQANGNPEPLLIDAIGNISQYGQQKIDIYMASRNLSGELAADRYPPPPGEKYLEWVPLYPAYRVGERYAEGLHVSDSEFLWAGVDAALILTPLKGSGKAASGAKVLAEAAEREVAETVVSQGERAVARVVLSPGERKMLATAGRELVSNSERTALEFLKHEGIDLARCGAEAGNIAMKRLEARGDGIVLGLADRSAEYAAARSSGDLGAESLIAEEIGLEGASKYAIETRCEPLYMGKARQGAGFDLVFRDGTRIKVIEAKGGGSQVKRFGGHWQGTPEYTRGVAEDVLARSSASEDEKAAAKEVLKAMEEGRLDIEVVRTEHVQGKPLPTRVESSVSVGNAAHLTASEIKSLLLRTPGATIAFVRDGGKESRQLAMESFINRSQAMASAQVWSFGNRGLVP